MYATFVSQMRGDQARKTQSDDGRCAKAIKFGPYDSWPTISNGHVMAPVWHTASQSVHQLHSAVSIMVTTLSTIAKASQGHTLTHNPHPSHLWASIAGISATLSNLHANHFKSKAAICL
jgi:hypothetical protein